MKKYLFLIFVLIILLVVFYYYFNNSTKQATVEINDKKFNVEVVKGSAEREKGLSNRDSLEVDAGMLFSFSKSDIQSMWMKDTKIPLDIIWINDNKIVEITTLSPDSEDDTPEHTPENKANYVLELNAGVAEEAGFKIGDQVKINY